MIAPRAAPPATIKPAVSSPLSGFEALTGALIGSIRTGGSVEAVSPLASALGSTASAATVISAGLLATAACAERSLATSRSTLAPLSASDCSSRARDASCAEAIPARPNSSWRCATSSSACAGWTRIRIEIRSAGPASGVMMGVIVTGEVTETGDVSSASWARAGWATTKTSELVETSNPALNDRNEPENSIPLTLANGALRSMTKSNARPQGRQAHFPSPSQGGCFIIS